MFKFIALSCVAASAAFAAMAATPAAAMAPAPLAVTADNPAVIDAAVRCGPRAHYVKGHRDRHGHYIKGRCVRDKRR